MAPRNDKYKRIFEPDKGTLLFVTVFDVDAADWQRLLDYVSREFLVAYSEDGDQKPLPSASSILKAREISAVMLEVMLPGFTLNSHLEAANQIRLDVLPEDVDSDEKAGAVFHLMMSIANALGKHVFLTPELGSATDDELRQKALCEAAPKGAAVQCRI
ncbi:MAG TPA: hypothetical protein VMP68_29645 [Candidatus Eisenbacteria bacterium]|nr:hypothetical protein [Candidatus Eisenbacteria bacterium]